ncbi:MAG: hypothetical protein IPG89_11175 [Bacteroidetes bacterium]|nr:hypothetical protein [Bacteroidota bacterium]
MISIYEKEFIPGKGYKGICGFCNKEFYGKADKKYHSPCKIAFNNQKASKRNASIKDIKAVLIKNDEVLMDYYQSKGNSSFIAVSDLISSGFNSKHYTSTVKLSDGSVYYVINRYAYKTSENKKNVQIEKINNLKSK